MTIPDFLDEPPQDFGPTDYDLRHMQLYVRLLDAKADGADWREAAAILFGIAPDRDPERARHVHDSHLRRAHWMSEHGYRLLLKRSVSIGLVTGPPIGSQEGPLPLAV